MRVVVISRFILGCVATVVAVDVSIVRRVVLRFIHLLFVVVASIVWLKVLLLIVVVMPVFVLAIVTVISVGFSVLIVLADAPFTM